MIDNLNFIPKIGKRIFVLFNILELRLTSLLFIIFIFFVATFIDLIGISILYPFIIFILDSSTQIDNEIFKYLSFNFLSFDNATNKILFIGLILLLLFFIKFIIAIFISYIVNSFSFNQVIKIRFMLAQKYANVDFQTFIKKNSSEYINILNNISGDLNTVIISFLRMINDILTIICFIVFLLIFNFYITSILVFIFMIIFTGYNFFLKNKLVKFGEIININANLFIKRINELMAGFREINILSKQDFFINEIDKHSKIFSKYRIIFNVINSMPKYFLELVFMIFIIFVIFYYSFINIISSEQLLSLIAIFLLVSLRMFPSVTSILSNLSRLHYVRNSIDIVINEMQSSNAKNIIRTIDNSFLFENIEFIDVSFAFNKKSPLIKNINFKINKYDIVGIKGSSGKGKTTLINLIIGFLHPKSGKILINGIADYTNINNFINCISYLPQDVFLIDGTIAENVALGEKVNLDSEMKIYDSLKKANLYNFVNNLDSKINTNIGDKGVKISGGQKQRIAISRSLYFNKDILIFDESTSSLDKNTAKKIIDEIFTLKNKLTIILISHNIDFYKICNKVIDLDDK
jgi:ATP-binding cassette, subfamily B, bacterial PglK